MILVDTGPLVAAALRDDGDHHARVELLTGLHLAGRRILVPSTVVAEVGHLLARESGPTVEATLLTSLADGDLASVSLTSEDFRRMAALVRQYGDLPPGTTDASVIALAERLAITEIATLDRRHFSVVRPPHTQAFTLSQSTCLTPKTSSPPSPATRRPESDVRESSCGRARSSRAAAGGKRLDPGQREL